jgi:hypothetical protein
LSANNMHPDNVEGSFPIAEPCESDPIQETLNAGLATKILQILMQTGSA